MSIIPIPRKVFDAVEDEQQFRNALATLTACSEREGDALFAKEAFLNETVEVPIEHYKGTF